MFKFAPKFSPTPMCLLLKRTHSVFRLRPPLSTLLFALITHCVLNMTPKSVGQTQGNSNIEFGRAQCRKVIIGSNSRYLTRRLLALPTNVKVFTLRYILTIIVILPFDVINGAWKVFLTPGPLCFLCVLISIRVFKPLCPHTLTRACNRF